MQIQINTDNRAEVGAQLREQAQAAVEAALARFGNAVTRVEIHLADVNAEKSGPDDKRCVIEARLAGRPPVAVTDHSSTFLHAVTGAAEKLERKLDSTLGKLSRR